MTLIFSKLFPGFLAFFALIFAFAIDRSPLRLTAELNSRSSLVERGGTIDVPRKQAYAADSANRAK